MIEYAFRIKRMVDDVRTCLNLANTNINISYITQTQHIITTCVEFPRSPRELIGIAGN